jgi:hypothetical protein
MRTRRNSVPAVLSSMTISPSSDWAREGVPAGSTSGPVASCSRRWGPANPPHLPDTYAHPRPERSTFRGCRRRTTGLAPREAVRTRHEGSRHRVPAAPVHRQGRRGQQGRSVDRAQPGTHTPAWQPSATPRRGTGYPPGGSLNSSRPGNRPEQEPGRAREQAQWAQETSGRWRGPQCATAHLQPNVRAASGSPTGRPEPAPSRDAIRQVRANHRGFPVLARTEGLSRPPPEHPPPRSALPRAARFQAPSCPHRRQRHHARHVRHASSACLRPLRLLARHAHVPRHPDAGSRTVRETSP